MLRRLLEIRQGEGRMVWLLGGHLFLFLAAQTLLSAVAKGLFIDTWNAANLPYTYVGASLATFLMMAGYFQVRRLRPAVSSVVIIVVLVALLAGLRVAAAVWERQVIFALLIVAPAFGAIVGTEHAILTRSQLDSRSARRLFPAIGTLGGVGASGAGFLVPVLRSWLPALDLFWISAVLLATTLIPRLRVKVQRQRGAKLRPAAWGRILRHRYSLLLMGLVFISAMLPSLTDYQLGKALQELRPGADSSAFYGQLNGWISAVSVVFTLFVSRLLIGKLGLGKSGLVYPLVVAAASVGGVLVPGLIAATGLVVSERLLRQNLQRPILSLTFMPLPVTMRARMGLAMSGVLRPVAVVLASGSILLVGPRLHWSAVSWATGGLALAFLLCALLARRDYVRELISALHSRRLRVEADEIDAPRVLDARVRELLHGQLGSEYPEQVALALQLMRGRCDRSTVTVIERQWAGWPPWVRVEAVRALGEEPVSEGLAFLRALDEREPEEVRSAVLRCPSVEPDEAELESLAGSGPPAVRGEALRLLARRRSPEAVRPTLEEWVASADPRLHRAAAGAIAGIDGGDFGRLLPPLARYAPAETLAAVARHPDPELTALCMRYLGDDRLFSEARRALLAIGEAGLPVLLESARDRDRSAQAVAILGELRGSAARAALLGMLEDRDAELRFRAARALDQRAESLGETAQESDLEVIRQAARGEVESCRAALAGRGAEQPIVRQEAADEFEWALERLLTLLSLLDPGRPYRRIYLSLVSGEKEDRSFAIEALDETLASEWKSALLPMLDDEPEPPADGGGRNEWLERLRSSLEAPGSEPDLELAVRLKECSLFRGWQVRDLEPLARAVRERAPEAAESYLLIRGGEPVEPERTLLSGESPEISGADDVAVPLVAIYRTVARHPRCGAAWLRGLAERLTREQQPGEDVSRTTLMSLASRTVVDDHDQAEDLDLWRRIFFLRSMELLAGLSSERLRLVAEIARPLSAEPGEVIMREGRLGNHFYLVCTGSAEVTVGGRRTALLAPSEGFGALALLSGRGRSATVRALERCELLSIERIDFLDLTDAHPSLTRAFARMIARYALAARES